MRLFVDTEFSWPHLLSVGIHAENGSQFYREIVHAHVQRNEFLDTHVLPQLHGVVREVAVDRLAKFTETRLICPTRKDEHDCPLVTPAQLREDLLQWVAALNTDQLEFWADYGAYDYVILCEALGGMACWPEGWPMYFNDLQSFAHLSGIIVPEIVLGETPLKPHHALYDAMVCCAGWQMLKAAETAIAAQVMKKQYAQNLRSPGGLVLPGGPR